MTIPIRLAISTCPNDTFAFHGLMTKQVDWRGVDFSVELLDIQQLNDRLAAGDFDVAKASFHAALLMAKDTVVLPCGSALGFGVGPLLLSAEDGDVPNRQNQVTLCPGELTTAALLFQLFYPQATSVQHVVFSDIMPKLKMQQADFGVCIHEGRFTWQAEGVGLVEDLGERWESETNSPLPLGGILARRSMAPEQIDTVRAVILDSLQYALENPSSALPTMRKHAQEFNDDVLMKHVDLYVNEWTQDLGDVGKSALRELSERALSIGLVDSAVPPIEVF